MAETCSWLIEPDSWELCRPTEEDGKVPHECGRTAVVAYTKKNPRSREPDQPEILRYPRCRSHDTNEARRVAPAQGFDIQEVV
jgi:hypothetical protein